MSSLNSEENKSSSMTSESEIRAFRQKIRDFKYSTMPKLNQEIRKYDRIGNFIISTNLFELKFTYDYFKFNLFSIDILPEIAEDNFPLLRIIYTKIDAYLPKCFKKTFWSGKNFYAIIEEKEKQDYEDFVIKVEVEQILYSLKFHKVKEILLKKVNDFGGGNQKIKSMFENLFRNIIMKNPNIIKFHDRTIFEVDSKNITGHSNNNYYYSGYITSAQITENGLCMLINNKNKLITGKTVLTKMIEIRKKGREQNMSERDIYSEIKNYFKKHKTVLTVYSLRAYKIQDINFDKNPSNTSIKCKDKDGFEKTISLINYYKIQYNVDIKSINQPLIIAENNFQKNQKLLSSNDTNYEIYLIPEIVYLTGLEEETTGASNRRGNINLSGIKNPSDKMRKIRGIYNLINSNHSKEIKNKKGEKIKLPSPKELTEKWGINLGSNLTFQGAIFPQPHLFFNQKEVNPENGRFRTGNPLKSGRITNTNIFYVYDKNDNKIDHTKLFIEIMKICKEKNFIFSNDFHPNRVKGYAIENTNNWENIRKSISSIGIDENKFGIIFCSKRLEQFYEKLKNYFLRQLNIPTQHCVTKKLLDGKKGRSIMYNLVDQINIKSGGRNFDINLVKENIIKSNQVFLIIGLDSKKSEGFVNYSMTSSTNFTLNNFYTQENTCEEKTQPMNNTLMKMFEEAINQIMKHSPHCPDYIIIYRQGGNEYRNKKLTVLEYDNFKEVLNDLCTKYKDKDSSHNFKNTKLYYICCNLKSDLKFFETKSINGQKEYYNPKSGLIVDEKVTQSNKFEFYIQPQFVNQGSATPCHYQVMQYDKNSEGESDLKLEILEKLTFYLSFYYWTWSGAIRVPSLLKMSTTAMDFYRKIYDDNYYYFENPIYI